MNRLLRLYIPVAWPAQTTACEWQLCDAAGNPLQMGCSEPRHWPEAERCEIILDAAQCLLLKTPLPKGARARTAEVLAYALEDRLIGEAGDEHLVVGDTPAAAADTDTQATPVWVVSRARLRTLLAVLRPLGRVPERLIAEIQLAPRHAGWTVCLHGAHGQLASGFARLGAEEGFSFDLPDPATVSVVPPFELSLALRAAQKDGQMPGGIDLYGNTGVDAATAAAWQQSLGVPVRLAGTYAWRDHTGRDARNLLTGEFAPPRQPRQGWGAWRPALLLGVLIVATYSAYSFGEWLWLGHRRGELKQQIAESFRTVAPQGQALLDPPLQMQRLHDRLRRERGQPGTADFLPLLAATGELIGGQGTVRAIGYDDGRLEFFMIMKSAADAERLRDTLTRRGFGATLRDTRPASGGGIEVQFAVRGAP